MTANTSTIKMNKDLPNNHLSRQPSSTHHFMIISAPTKATINAILDFIALSYHPTIFNNDHHDHHNNPLYSIIIATTLSLPHYIFPFNNPTPSPIPSREYTQVLDHSGLYSPNEPYFLDHLGLHSPNEP